MSKMPDFFGDDVYYTDQGGDGGRGGSFWTAWILGTARRPYCAWSADADANATASALPSPGSAAPPFRRDEAWTAVIATT